MANPVSGTSDILRFATVRSVSLPETGAVARRFITLQYDDNKLLQQSTEIAKMFALSTPTGAGAVTEFKEKSFLLVTSKDLPVEADRETLVKQLEGPLSLPSITEFLALLPDPHAIYLWHRNNNADRSTSRAKLVSALAEVLGRDVEDYADTDRFYADFVFLCESLIALYVSRSSPSLRADAVSLIRLFWLIELVVRDTDALADGQAIYEAMHATVLLPPGVARTPATQDQPETREHGAAAASDDDVSSLRLLLRAEHELSNIDRSGVTVSRAETKFSRADQLRELSLREADAATGSVTRESGRAATQKKEAASEQHFAANGTKVATSIKLVKDDQFTELEIERLGKETLEVMARLNMDPKRSTPEQATARVRQEIEWSTREASRKRPSITVNVDGHLIQLDNGCYHYTPPDPCKPYAGRQLSTSCGINIRHGVADLKVIRTTLLKYDLGEIAHIENVLKGEIRTREFNVLERSEQTLMTDVESDKETEQDTQSTDRFELNRETANVVKEDMKFEAGVNVSASLGPVTIATNVDFAYSQAKEESTRTSTQYAQELVNRVVNRITEKKRTTSTVTTIRQTEDKTSHSFKNDGMLADNISGMYRWVEKHYLAKVVNYGKRLMLDLMVPEPAAFYIFSRSNRPKSSDRFQKPEPPTYFSAAAWAASGGVDGIIALESFKNISTDNYAALAAAYEAKISPPPPSSRIVTTSIKHDKPAAGEHDSEADKADNWSVEVSKELVVPDGYQAVACAVTYKNNALNCTILIGDKHIDSPFWSGSNLVYYASPWFAPLSWEDKIVPIVVLCDSRHFAVNVEVRCELTSLGLDQWKINTFDAIMEAYQNKLKAYQDWEESQQTAASFTPSGQDPTLNRMTEKEELKKSCIELISNQRFEAFSAMLANTPDFGYPEFDFDKADEEGKYIQFFEQCFEWEQITYTFYPYYWGRKPNWVVIKSLNDTDFLFTKFLQAGAARVLVPVRPGFEPEVIHFLASGGEIWAGKDPPIPGSPDWISVVDELKEQQGVFDGGMQEGDPWIVRMPTSLVSLAPINAALPDYSSQYAADVARVRPEW